MLSKAFVTRRRCSLASVACSLHLRRPFAFEEHRQCYVRRYPLLGAGLRQEGRGRAPPRLQVRDARGNAWKSNSIFMLMLHRSYLYPTVVMITLREPLKVFVSPAKATFIKQEQIVCCICRSIFQSDNYRNAPL